MPPTSRATVVLPVPGLPTKTRCRVMVTDLSPAFCPSPSTRSTATCWWISALTSVSPVSASSSASSSSSVLGGGSGCAGFGGCLDGALRQVPGALR